MQRQELAIENGGDTKFQSSVVVNDSVQRSFGGEQRLVPLIRLRRITPDGPAEPMFCRFRVARFGDLSLQVEVAKDSQSELRAR